MAMKALLAQEAFANPLETGWLGISKGEFVVPNPSPHAIPDKGWRVDGLGDDAHGDDKEADPLRGFGSWLWFSRLWRNIRSFIVCSCDGGRPELLIFPVPVGCPRPGGVLGEEVSPI